MAVSTDAAARRTFGSGARWGGRLSLVVGITLSLYILLLVNIIAFRHPLRIDLTAEGLHTLSERTLDRLELVQEPIRVVLPSAVQAQNPRLQAELEVLIRALGLLHEMMQAQPLIRVEEEFDIFQEPERWVDVRSRFDLAETQVNRFIFFAGEGNEFRQAVTAADLATFGAVSDPISEQPQVLEFHGEKVLADAIMRLIKRSRLPIYFTQDKQELFLLPAPGAAARGRADAGALNALRSELETAGFEPRELALSSVEKIPDDCRLLVIAQPFQSYRHEELLVIDRYLQGGGKLLVTLGPGVTGLESLLAEWGVEVKPGRIVLRRVAVEGSMETSNLTIRRYNPRHPVTEPFLQGRVFQAQILNCRALTAAGQERRLAADPLLETYSGPGDTHLRAGTGGSREIFEKGDFTVAIAVAERPPTSTVPPNYTPLDTRLIVAGASNWLRDENFPHLSHRDFFLNCVDWLVGAEDVSGTSGTQWAERTLDMSGGFRIYVRWVPTVVIPGIFLLLGVFVYFLRRV